MRRLIAGGWVVLVGAALIAGCGSDSTEFNDSQGGGGLQDANTFGSFDGNFAPNSDGGSGGLASCATETRKAETLPLDMVIGLDTSFSMDFDNKWTSVKSALKSFASNPAYSELGLGLQFFPLRKQCSVADYAAPIVGVTRLPDVATSLNTALDAQRMSGGTPMVPLLEGVSSYLKIYSAAHPKRKPVLVLASDGIPDNTCLGSNNGATPNTLENAVKTAENAFTGSPSVSTFVIGVGSELSALNAIGQAGGTGDALLVDTAQNVELAFLEALAKIRTAAIPCDFDIPIEAGATVDPNKVNVTYAPAGGSSEVFVYVGSAEDCAKSPTNGWYFNDASNPTKVILCPASCERVKSDDRGQVDVVFGCDRVSVK